MSSGQRGHQGPGSPVSECVCVSVCVCVCVRALIPCVLILLLRQMYSAKCITAPEAMVFHDSLAASFFLY